MRTHKAFAGPVSPGPQEPPSLEATWCQGDSWDLRSSCACLLHPHSPPHPIWPWTGFHSELFPHLDQAVVMICVGYQAPRSVQDIITPPPPTSGPAWKGGSKPRVRRVETPGQLAGAQFHLE